MSPQKCDRQQPCGLCKSRNVEHLCRWELEPYARPQPARPPAKLERSGSVEGQSSASYSSCTPHKVEPSLDPETTPDGTVVDQEVKEAAIALAQLSVARQGEYMGLGSLVCALHKVSSRYRDVALV
jgi:hypothetical protein